MVLIVERNSPEPIYGQIARQIRERIVAGELPAGGTLPPVRRVASDLGVNLNTVARAYRLLAEEGFLRIRHRERTEIAAPPSVAHGHDRRRLTEELRALLARMRQVGLASDELHRICAEEIARLAAAVEREKS